MIDTCDWCGAPVDRARERCRYCDHSFDPCVRYVLRELNKPYVSKGPPAQFMPLVRGNAKMVIG